MRHREYGEHHRQRDQRRARHDDERHVDDEVGRDRRQQQRLPDFPFAQQREDGESEHDRAQHEFLALVDVVLDEDAVPVGSPGAFSVRLGINRDDPGRDRQQRAGRQERDEYPHAARRALEMIEQERQHQQLRRGAQRIEARAPGRVRPQGSQRRQRNERNRQRADRPLQRSQERAQFERRGQRGKPDAPRRCRRRWSTTAATAQPDRDEIDVEHARRTDRAGPKP